MKKKIIWIAVAACAILLCGCSQSQSEEPVARTSDFGASLRTSGGNRIAPAAILFRKVKEASWKARNQWRVQHHRQVRKHRSSRPPLLPKSSRHPSQEIRHRLYRLHPSSRPLRNRRRVSDRQKRHYRQNSQLNHSLLQHRLNRSSPQRNHRHHQNRPLPPNHRHRPLM